MHVFVKLWEDVTKLWSRYAGLYLNGVWNTISLAVRCTAVGCIIGLFCGVLNTIPYSQNDPAWKRFLLKFIRAIVRIYVEVFRGTPMVLQAVFL